MRYHKSVKVIDSSWYIIIMLRRLWNIFAIMLTLDIKSFPLPLLTLQVKYTMYKKSNIQYNWVKLNQNIIILIVRKLYQKGEKNLTHNAFLVFTCRDWNRTGSFGDGLNVGRVRGEPTSSGRGLVPVGWQVSTDHCTHHSIYICRLQFLNL